MVLLPLIVEQPLKVTFLPQNNLSLFLEGLHIISHSLFSTLLNHYCKQEKKKKCLTIFHWDILSICGLSSFVCANTAFLQVCLIISMGKGGI